MSTLKIFLKKGKENDIKCKIAVDDLSGLYVITTYQNICDPASVLPDIPEGSIEKVTYTETIHKGFRKNGFYEEAGVCITFKTIVKYHGHAQVEKEVYQHISGSATNLKDLQDFYRKVRSGKVDPVEDWTYNSLSEDEVWSDHINA